MTDKTAQLAISADATGVETGVGKAKKSLASLGATAKTAGNEASKGLEGMGDGAEKGAAKVQRSTQNLVNSIQRTTAAIEAGSRSSSKYFETLAQQRGIDVNAIRPMLDALDAANAKQAAAVVQLAKGSAALNQYGLSAKQTSAALRGVPAQLTDIIVSLQGGQNPINVLLQQGGQLRDMFGGIVPAAKALGGAFLGLLNPLTLTVGAVAALTLAYEKGRKESENYARALILTGNAAGVTSGQMQVMAQNIDAVTGTQAGAAAALADFVSQNAAASENLERFTQVAIRFEKVGGDAVSETAKKFAELRKAPLEAAIKLNEGTNFLTRSIYEQIKALTEQGRTIEAANVAQRAFADTIDSRTGQIEKNLGLIERGWKAIKSAISDTVDAALNIGRVAGPEAQLAAAQNTVARLEAMQQSRQSRGLATGDIDPQLAAARAFVETQKEVVKLSQRAAAGQAQQVAALQATLAWDKIKESNLKEEVRLEREIAQAREAGARAGRSQAEIEQVVANIRAKRSKKAPDTERVDARAAALLDIEKIKSAASEQVNAITNAERIIEAIRSAGLLDERAYYDEKRRLLTENTRLQVEALEAENARLNQEKLNTKDSLDRDRKVTENLTTIARLQANASTQAVILNAQETAAIQAKASAILTARQALEDYFQIQQRQQDRDLQGLGQGRRQRELSQGIGQIEDRYGSQRRDLENQRAQLELEGKFTAEARKQYDARLALIDEFQRRSIDSYTDYYQRLKEAQQDWALGATEAIRNYYDESTNLFAQTERAVASALQGMEDALVKFVTTGKLDFKSLADSIIADITRMIIKQQIMIPLMRALFPESAPDFVGPPSSAAPGGGGGFLGTIFSSLLSGFRADGGPVSAGKLYRVNERGPELLNVAGSQYLMMGNQSGRVDPNPQPTVQRSGDTFNLNFYQPVNHRSANQAAGAVALQQRRAARLA